MKTNIQQLGALAVFTILTIGGDICAQEHNTYQVVNTNLTWHEAKLDAERRGGHLATITSQEEFDYILSLGLTFQYSDGYWLGATDEAQEGTWVWITGEPWDFTAWSANEPNNQGPENYLVGGSNIGNRWNDWGQSSNPTPHYLLEIERLCTPRKAKATAQLVNGFVVEATVTDAGCGYANPPAVRVEGGGGRGAEGRAVVANGQVTGIIMTDAGCCYTSIPRIVIASPPFVPTLSISTSRVRVVQSVVLGRNYVLESSHDARDWSEAAPQFTANSESITNEFDVDVSGRFFRVREVP